MLRYPTLLGDKDGWHGQSALLVAPEHQMVATIQKHL
jgi:hypothetical protein